MFGLIHTIFSYVPNNFVRLNRRIDSTTDFSSWVDKLLIIKLTDFTTRMAAVDEGTVDLLDTIGCKDGIYAIANTVGVRTDFFQICASSILGPNITMFEIFSLFII
jgi:hypothetical protein